MKNNRKTKTRARIKAENRRRYAEMRAMKPPIEATCTPRKLARSVAKANMAKRGYQKPNRIFWICWRKFV